MLSLFVFVEAIVVGNVSSLMRDKIQIAISLCYKIVVVVVCRYGTIFMLPSYSNRLSVVIALK